MLGKIFSLPDVVILKLQSLNAGIQSYWQNFQLALGT